MKPYATFFSSRSFFVALIISFLLLAAICPATAAASSTKPEAADGLTEYVTAKNDAQTRSGFDHYYELDYDAAIRDFQAAMQAHPRDPYAVNHLLAAVFFKELYKAGALESNAYASNSFLSNHTQIHLDSATDARIKELIGRAMDLASKRLSENSNDAKAYYARGVAHGMESTYTALVQKGWFAALGDAKAARQDHEKALELAPDFSDARLVVGMHSYIVGSLPWPIRVLAHVVGESGNRSTGIRDLYAAAEGGGDASVDAKVVLALFLRREHRYSEALALEHNLAGTHSRNFLFAVEEANILKDSGDPAGSIAAYRRVLTKAQGGGFQDPQLEFAFYGLAEVLRGQHDFAGAAEAYSSAANLAHANPQIRLRAQLAAGEMYDLLQQRELAIKMYRSVITADASSEEAATAREGLKEPYRN